MKTYYTKALFILEVLIISLVLFSFSFASENSDKCGISIEKTYNQEVMAKNIGFMVHFKNNSLLTMDAIDYSVIYKNGFNEVKGTLEFTWQAGNFFGPKLPGETLKDGATTWIDGANKIEVVIKRVHFTDGSSCN
jgi:hypothetical protein